MHNPSFRQRSSCSCTVRYLNAPAERLREIELPPGAEWDVARAALAANKRLLDELLFAPLDYAIVARAGQ